ncbi:MAG TPA: hypothetical protein PLP33_25415 [Leptospiraceae bacterium]|nr:hypothetical protein [Leptospiraceae bacterium]
MDKFNFYNDSTYLYVYLVFCLTLMALLYRNYDYLVYKLNSLFEEDQIYHNQDKFVDWIEHFKTEQINMASKGEKALANPFDNSTHGIPTNEELEILCAKITDLGYKAHINNTYKEYVGPAHLTVVWN